MLHKLLDATRYSWRGLQAAWAHEQAFRLEVYLSLLLVPAALFVGSNLTHKLLLLLPCGLVLLMELVNSAIESAIDRIGTEQNELSARAKDLGSAGVFVSLMIFLVLWIPSLWQFFHDMG
ncbi:MAG: diacylglycerol kinase [Halieaceae bacterium]|nr:diacylglycerol kinase [Halieaceae bacterium]